MLIRTNPRATMEECWDGTWNPPLARALSDQKIKEFMFMQQSIVHNRPQSGVCDGWEWISDPFSIRGAYKRLCEGQYEEDILINRACKFI